MQYDLIIKNGKIVSSESTLECDIAIVGEKIVALGSLMMLNLKRLLMHRGNILCQGL